MILKPNFNSRYTDVPCYDHTRVQLTRDQTSPDPEHSDYIHANFVDGYRQRHAYISTQGPLARTAADFWRMVWEQHALVIVMTTRAVERGRAKCHQYWEPEEGSTQRHADLEIKTITVRAEPDCTVTELRVTCTRTEERRDIQHWQFTSWPDYGVPRCARATLRFLAGVRAAQASAVKALGDTWAGHTRGPPIVVHCSAGIGRTGTFCTLDTCISRLEDQGSCDVRGTVERIRSQRAFSIQMPDQYVFCHLALVEYALMRGLLSEPPDLTDFHNLNESDSE